MNLELIQNNSMEKGLLLKPKILVTCLTREVKEKSIPKKSIITVTRDKTKKY